MKSICLIVTCLLLVNSIFALNKENDCKCRIQSQSRIIGGKIAHPQSYPWQVALAMKDLIPVPDVLRKLVPDFIKVSKLFCGASVINERWILTAGHCIEESGISAKDIRVGYGSNDLVEIYNKNQYIEVEEVFVHPDYALGASNVLNDVALLKLKEPLPAFGKKLQPACLTSGENVDKYEGLLKISGFGSTVDVTIDLGTGKKSATKISRWLKEADVYDNSESLEICQRNNIEQNICISNKDTNETACKGDSGGPLHEVKNGKSYVVGVASFVSHKTDKKSKITVCTGETAYTRLSTMMPFILSHVGGDHC